MAPRKRTYKNLEDNLYQNEVKGKIYYRYKHPITGKLHGMGSDKRKANTAARVLNQRLMQSDCLVGHVLGINHRDMNYAIGRFREDILPGKKLAAGTLKNYNYRLDRIGEDI
jgi:hypothetical protein